MLSVHVLCLSLALALVDASTADPDAVRLLHRIYHPSRPSEPFTTRGALHLHRLASSSPHTPGQINAASLVADESLHDGWSHLEQTFESIVDDLHSEKGMTPTKASQEVLYQLALEHPGDSHHSQWHVSSVKACHLTHMNSERLILHLSSNTSAAPFALDYFVWPLPHNGACPRLPAPKRTAASSSDSDAEPDETRRVSFANRTRQSETVVDVKAPRVPPLPTLKSPPPLTVEGKPVQAPEEKSFIQKYWVYIAVAMVALVMSPAPAEEEGQGGQGGGGGGRR